MVTLVLRFGKKVMLRLTLEELVASGVGLWKSEKDALDYWKKYPDPTRVLVSDTLIEFNFKKGAPVSRFPTLRILEFRKQILAYRNRKSVDDAVGKL